MEIEQRIYSGARAREVLESEAFIEAFEAIEKDIAEKWKNSPARDAEGREKLWIYQHLLSQLKQQLVSTMETGKLAQMEVNHKKSLLERMTGMASWHA